MNYLNLYEDHPDLALVVQSKRASFGQGWNIKKMPKKRFHGRCNHSFSNVQALLKKQEVQFRVPTRLYNFEESTGISIAHAASAKENL